MPDLLWSSRCVCAFVERRGEGDTCAWAGGMCVCGGGGGGGPGWTGRRADCEAGLLQSSVCGCNGCSSRSAARHQASRPAPRALCPSDLRLLLCIPAPAHPRPGQMRCGSTGALTALAALHAPTLRPDTTTSASVSTARLSRSPRSIRRATSIASSPGRPAQQPAAPRPPSRQCQGRRRCPRQLQAKQAPTGRPAGTCSASAPRPAGRARRVGTACQCAPPAQPAPAARPLLRRSPSRARPMAHSHSVPLPACSPARPPARPPARRPAYPFPRTHTYTRGRSHQPTRLPQRRVRPWGRTPR